VSFGDFTVSPMPAFPKYLQPVPTILAPFEPGLFTLGYNLIRYGFFNCQGKLTLLPRQSEATQTIDIRRIKARTKKYYFLVRVF